METDTASRTAVLVCQGRAVAHGRLAVGRFDDPTAIGLLREDERRPVATVRAGVPPRGFAARIEFERLRASAEVMVPRTVAIDDALVESANPQVVIVGAGLDGRAWRMRELATVDVFEVDHPASQRDKRDRLGSLPRVARTVRFVPVDFTNDDLDTALATTGHAEDVPSTWVWEGVIPYLTNTEVATTLKVISSRSAPSSRLVVNYQAPSIAATVGRLFARSMTILTRRDDPTANEPRRSSWTPEVMRRLLAANGFATVRDHDLDELAEGLAIDVTNHRSLAAGRVAVARRSSPLTDGRHSGSRAEGP
jgi:methyltransferase (TIGR00027 family)